MILLMIVLPAGIIFPQIIYRNSQQNNYQSGESIFRLVYQENHHNDHCSQDVESRNDRVAKGLVGTGYVRPFDPQDKNSKYGNGEKKQDREDHIIKQVAVCTG